MATAKDIDNSGSSTQTDEQIFTKLAMDRNKSYLSIDEKNFLTPDMGDYIKDDNMTLSYLREMGAKLGPNVDPYDVKFYTGPPFSETLGYHEEANAFVIKATPVVLSKDASKAERADKINQFDGDTMYFDVYSIIDKIDSPTFKIGDVDYKNFQDYVEKNNSVKSGQFGLRLLGLNTPEVPHYTVIPDIYNQYDKLETRTYGEAKGNLSVYNFDRTASRKDGDATVIKFIKLNDSENVYNEVIDTNYRDSEIKKLIKEDKLNPNEDHETMRWLKILTKDESIMGDKAYADDAIKAKDIMKDLLKNNEEMIIVVDAQGLTKASGSSNPDERYPNPYTSDSYMSDTIRAFWSAVLPKESSLSLGYNAYGQDAYQRFLGAIYVKKAGLWINVAKYILANCKKAESLPDYTSNPATNSMYSYNSDAFKLWTYDKSNGKIIDSLENMAKDDFDDRRAIQRSITNIDFDYMKDYTTMIGDCLFMVPPTSIRCITQTTTEKMPLLRAKGSVTKSSPKSERLVQMTLYFNDEAGINGYPVPVTLPGFDPETGEKEVTYYMNGLRPLLSMFKMTPFLPIENTYINDVLQMEAVSLVNIQVATVPGYPKLISAVLTLQEFNYRIYMPELPPPDDDYKKNMFAETINFETMRWYYQRPLIRGAKIRSIEDPLSDEYIKATFGGRTALQPMDFGRSYVEFFTVDESYLKQQLKIKQDAITRIVVAPYKLNEKAKEFIKQVGQIYDGVNKMTSSTEFKDAINNINYPETGMHLALDHHWKGGYFWESRSNAIGATYLRIVSDELRGGSNIIEVRANEVMSDYISPILKVIENSLIGKTPLIQGVQMKEYKTEDDNVNYLHWDVFFKISKELMASEADIQNTLKAISTEINIPVDKFYEDDKIKITFTAAFSKPKGLAFGSLIETKSGDTIIPRGITLDLYGSGMEFLSKCSGVISDTSQDEIDEILDNEADTFASYDTNQDIKDRKEAVDVETINSLKFIEYMTLDKNNVNIKSLSAVFGNTMTKINIQEFDGNAPQYAGGQDTAIEISIETMDDNVVTLLTNLPRHSARQIRDYRQVLTVWPLRINSEITRLLGIHEVVIESVDSSTVASQPGLFQVNMRLVSVDRTLRNREALKKLENVNNAGSKSISATESRNTKTYFDLQKEFSKAEVYPDLELPTIDELSKAGFQFIRYGNNLSNRIFPDPDFYFVYGHALCSQLFRDTILYHLKDQTADTLHEFEISDRYGAKIVIKPNSKDAYSVTAANDIAELMKSDKKKIQDAADELVVKQKKLADGVNIANVVSDKDIVNALSNTDAYQGWDITSKIKCIFREKKYEQSFKSKDDYYVTQIDSRVKNIISIIDEELGRAMIPLDSNAYSSKSRSGVKYDNWTDKSFIREMGSELKQAVFLNNSIEMFIDDFFKDKDSVGYRVFKEFGIEDEGKKVRKALLGMIRAVSAASTAQKEFNGKKGSMTWQGRIFSLTNTEFSLIPGSADVDTEGFLKPICNVEINGQGYTGSAMGQAANITDAITLGSEFGPYLIKTYSKNDIKVLTNEIVTMDGEKFFIDPYYRTKATAEELKTYKHFILTDPYVSTHALIRNMLFWMKKMLQDGILFSLFDIIQDKAIDIIEDKQAANSDTYSAIGWKAGAIEQAINPVTEDVASSAILKELKKIMDKNQVPIAIGKLFAPLAVALTGGDSSLYGMLLNKNYSGLNELVRSCQTPSADYLNDYKNTLILRKFILAMDGFGVIEPVTRLGSGGKDISEVIENINNEKIFLAAAENPSAYILHSFYDMVMNDKRGRMLRAFPTFYMVFIDEGRDIGLWHLHDNFYNISAISEIQVTKSRKIAGDTARIVMSNMFKTFTTDDEDAKTGYEYTWKDAYNSVFSPRTYYLQEELRRMQAEPVERIKLQPGVRIHLRMGYGADAANLPIIFNGVVAEVGAGEAVEIIAQGDGAELTNPIMSSTDAEDVQFEEKFVLSRLFNQWLTKGATPNTILTSLITSKGTWMKKMIREWTGGRFFNNNPYGITHFGDPEYKAIFKNGECVQNIYEATATPSWGNADENAMMGLYQMPSAPKISTHIFGKSFWDIMHICASVSPDFVTSIIPFGMRSSIFYGAPRYYAAYDYAESFTETGESWVREKRKPFQQFHIYTSYSDIIGNSIKASDKEVRTCAVGMYTANKWLGKEAPKRVGPMWVDFDIYPEKQKTMTVDTQLVAKGSVIGDIFPFINGLQDEFADDEGLMQGGQALAWRMTASALKNSVKDMYQGELIVIGDPSVKPYDRMWIEDTYDNMQGCCEVEAVVHNFTVEDGYTTSIFADAIATIDDRYEKVTQHVANDIVAKAVAVYVTNVSISKLFANTTKPLMTALVKYGAKSGELGVKYVNQLGNLIGQDELINNSKFLDKTKGLQKLLGVSTTHVKYDTFLASLNSESKLVNSLGKVDNIAEAAIRLETMANSINKIDPADLLKVLEDSMNDPKMPLNAKETLAVQEAIDELNGNVAKYAKLVNGSALDTKTLKSIESLANLTNVSKAGTFTADELAHIKKLAKSGMSGGTDDLAKVAGYFKKLDATVDAAKLADLLVDVNRVTDSVKSGVKFADTLKDSKKLLSAAKLAFGARIGLGMLAASAALEMAVTYALTAFAYEYVERWMKNLQVLQIYPLKKDGKPHTAGLEGSKGIVVGSSTYNTPGMIEGWLVNVLADKEGKNAGFYNVIKNMIASEDMMEIVSKYKRKEGIPDTGTLVGTENLIQGLLSKMAGDEMMKQNGFAAMMLQPRIDLNSKDLVMIEKKRAALKRYGLKDTETVEMNPNIIKELVPLYASKKLVELKEAGRLKFRHDLIADQEKMDVQTMKVYEASNDGEFYAKTKKFNIEGAVKAIPVIYDHGVLDMPFLRPDAYYVLIEIINRLEIKFKEEGNKYGEDEMFDKHNIIIHSALRVGDMTWARTGYSFTIEVIDYDLNDILEDVKTSVVGELFLVNKLPSSYQITICPPKLI
jgi:hypothetical protein